VVLEDFAVEDTKGDGVKSKGSDQITFRNLRVEWTNGPKETNGAYGVYPVSSKNVLIDGVFVKGAPTPASMSGRARTSSCATAAPNTMSPASRSRIRRRPTSTRTS
jgi:polygalacturonase